MDRRGFTLTELLVSISILMTITTMAIINFRNSEYGDELRYAAENVAAEIRRAQTFSLVSRTVLHCTEDTNHNGSFCLSGNNAQCGSGVCVNDPPGGGYGVRIESDPEERDLYFFADTGDSTRSGQIDHVYQEYELLRRLDIFVGRNVIVEEVTPELDGHLDISFVAPRPIAWFNGDQNGDGSPDYTIGKITLKHRKTNETVTITVNGISGQVSVD